MRLICWVVCGPALVEAPLSKISQAESLFDDILDLITFDPEATRPSIMAIYKEFQRAYLAILYPAVFAEYKLIRHEGFGFVKGCPAKLQTILVKYLTIWFLRAPDNLAVERVPASCFIIDELLLGSAVDSEIVHEILRQALLLPWDYVSSLKEVLALLRWWIFQPSIRRPQFLQEDLHAMLPKDHPNVADGLMEAYTNRYIRRLESLFDGRPSFGVEQQQYEVYREAIFLLRAIAMGAYFRPTVSVWDSLIKTCLGIVVTHFTVEPKQEVITVPENANAFAALIGETMIGVMVRSQSQEEVHWNELSQVLSKSTRWRPIVAEWSHCLLELSGILLARQFPQTDPIGRKHFRLASIDDLNEILLRAPDLPQHRPDNFLAWNLLEWTQTNVLFLWRNWIRALGNLTLIERPEVHEMAIRTLASVLDRLEAVRNGQVFDAPILPPIFDFAEAMFDAAERAERGFEASRCVAMACLSKMICRRSDFPLPDIYYSRFYLAVVNGLVDKDSPLALVTLRATSHIFSYDLPGSQVLIPAYLKCIASLLNGEVETKDVLVSILRLITSIAVLPDVYSDTYEAPRIEAPLPSMSQVPIQQAGDMNLGELRGQVEFFLTLTGQQLDADPLIQSQFISTLVVLLLNEVLAAPQLDQAHQSLIDKYFELLLSRLDTPNVAVFAAIETITQSIIQMCMDDERLVFFSQCLLSASHSALASSNEARVTMLMRGLLGWLMALPAGWLATQPVIQKTLLDLIQECHERGNEPGRAAELLLSHLLHHLDCYPMAPNGNDSASIDEIEGLRASHFSVGKDSIISAYQNNNGQATMILRNAAGCYRWNLETVYDDKSTEINCLKEALNLNGAIEAHSLDSYVPAERLSTVPYERTPRELPLYQEGQDLQGSDKLAHLLDYLDEEFPEMKDSTSGPDFVPPERTTKTEEVAMTCAEVIKLEAKLASQCKSFAQDMTDVFKHRQAKPAPFQPIRPAFHDTRMLLSQLGFLTACSKTSQKAACKFPVTLLRPLAGRELDSVDRIPARDQHKIGLIFVAAGVETEPDILGTDETSPIYDDFCKSLGIKSQVSGKAYAGGLAAEEASSILYWSDSTCEMVFHEPAKIKRDPDLLSRKRHICNDAVHIIWNEHSRPYRPGTLSGEFGNYQIILNPSPSGALYSVNIWADGRLSHSQLAVGPLFDGAIIPRALLAPLVRATALAASRVLTVDASGTPRLSNADARQVALVQLIEKYAMPGASPETFLTNAAFPQHH